MYPFFLRPLSLRDSTRMLEWMRDPDITEYLQIGGPHTTREMVESFICEARDERFNLHRAVVNVRDEYMGTVSLKKIDREKKEAEYAIAMHPSALGTGAATAATHQILRIAFDQVRLERVYLNVLKANRRAVGFYTKFGFRYIQESILDRREGKEVLLWYELRKEEDIK